MKLNYFSKYGGTQIWRGQHEGIKYKFTLLPEGNLELCKTLAEENILIWKGLVSLETLGNILQECD